MAPLPPRDQRHLWLRYQVVGYIEEIVHDFEQRLETIFSSQVNRVHILDFKGLTLDMRQDLAERIRMVYTKDDGQEDRGQDGVRCDWKSGAKLSGGHFIGRLAHHFGLVSDNGLRGLSVMARELPLIDMSELVFVASAFRAAEDAPTVDEGNQAYPAPVQASQPPPPPPTAGRTMPQRLGILEEEIQGLHRNVRSLCGLMESLMTDQGRVSTWMVSCMT
ncbi:hypothetical protein Tco_1280926, partial [Tanacetum coccineum]